MKSHPSVFIYAILLCSVGCTGLETKNSAPLQLNNKKWTAVSLSEEKMPLDSIHNHLPYVFFTQDGGFRGFTGCNRFNGHYQIQGEQILLNTGATTRMACQQSYENAFLESVSRVVKFQIIEDQLHLLDSNGKNQIILFHKDEKE